MYQNTVFAFLTLRPLLLANKVATLEEIEQAYQQALIEMQADDFYGMWYLMSFWGSKE